MTSLQSCPICKVGGLSGEDKQCPQCGSQLKIHHTFCEIDQKLQQGSASPPAISFMSKSLFILYSAVIILVAMIAMLFLKIETLENKMIAKINILEHKSDESLKSYKDIQAFKEEVNLNLLKTHELIKKLQGESEIIGTNIIELKERIITNKTNKKTTKQTNKYESEYKK
jgi:hypothetical protein